MFYNNAMHPVDSVTQAVAKLFTMLLAAWAADILQQTCKSSTKE